MGSGAADSIRSHHTRSCRTSRAFLRATCSRIASRSRSSFQGTFRPLPAIAELSASNLQYKLGLRLYQYSYVGTDPLHPEFGPTNFSWTPSNVSQHSLQSSLIFNTPVTTDSLALTAQLAPLTPTYTGLLSLAAGPAKGKVQGGFAEVAGVKQYQPVVASGTLDFGKPFNATEEVQFDVDSSTLTRSTSQLGMYGFSSAFVGERINNSLVPSTVRVGYESGGDPVWYWKDRIKDRSVGENALVHEPAEQPRQPL